MGRKGSCQLQWPAIPSDFKNSDTQKHSGSHATHVITTLASCESIAGRRKLKIVLCEA